MPPSSEFLSYPKAYNPGHKTGSLNEDDLPLPRVYRWERERAGCIFLTQPFAGGKVREWTWAQAADEARRMAAYLEAQDWEPGSQVAILSRNSAWWLMADLAIWMAGHVSVPIYPSLKARTVRHILEHSESKACFLGPTDEKEMASCGVPSGVHRICFPTVPSGVDPTWETVIATHPPISASPIRPADNLATIIYTSGTTGKPKGVMHRFGAFSAFAKSATELLGLTAEERLLSYLPLAHIVERSACEALGLRLGFHIFFTEGVETFLTDLRRARPTLFVSVPRLLLKFRQGVFHKIPKHHLDKLLRIPLANRMVKKRILRQLGLHTARYAASGSAPLPIEILLWYRNLGLELFEGYGLTETLVTHIQQPGLVRPGYVGGAIDRVKEQFKTSKGKYVAPAPIESELMAHPAIETCCVMGAGLPSAFAIVVLSPDARQGCVGADERKALEESLRARMEEVNTQLDPHERLNFIAIVDGPWTIGNELITPTLKIKRAAVEGRYQPFLDQWERNNRPVVWESAP